MTDDSWPQTAPPASTEGYPVGGGVRRAAADGSPSTTETAKDEATAVAGHAAEQAKNVAETAKAEVANVAAEAKTNARDLLQQAKSDLTDQAGSQQQKAAEGLRSISSELHTMADASDQPGVAADLIRQAADRSSAVASWLDNRDPGSLLAEVKSFARQRPGTFLLAAAGAGILAGRLGRSLQAGAPETPQGPSQPARLPAPGATPSRQEIAPAAGSGDRFFEEPVLTGTAGPVSTRTLPAGTTTDTALRDDSVSFPDREVRQP
jgi:hypothetical protein